MAIFYPPSGGQRIAALVKTEVALSKLHLFKADFTPSPLVTLAEMDLHEADYDGYTAGGETVTAFAGPIIDPLNGYAIYSGTKLFSFVAAGPDPITNTIGGWYLETAGGVLLAVESFPGSVPMQQAGQGVPVGFRLVFGNR